MYSNYCWEYFLLGRQHKLVGQDHYFSPWLHTLDNMLGSIKKIISKFNFFNFFLLRNFFTKYMKYMEDILQTPPPKKADPP